MPFGWDLLLPWKPGAHEFAVALTTPTPFHFKPARFSKGIDNVHIDVLLSGGLVGAARQLAWMAIYSEIDKCLGCGWAWAVPPGTRDIETFQRVYAGVMEAVLGAARATARRELALLAAFAAMKFLLVLVGEELERVREELRHERGHQSDGKAARLHDLLAQLARETPGIHHRVACKLFEHVLHVESGLLRQRRKALLGRSWPLPREMMFNPILRLPSLWSVEQAMRDYPLVGIDRDNPTEFVEVNAALTGLFAEHLPTWAQPAAAMAEEPGHSRLASSPRADQGDLAGFLDVELLLGRSLRVEEYVRGRTSWLDSPANLERIFRTELAAPGESSHASTLLLPDKSRRAVFRAHLVQEAQARFKSLGLLERIYAAPAVPALFDEARGQLPPQTLLDYLQGKLSRRDLAARLNGKGAGNPAALLKRLETAKAAIRGLGASERRQRVATFLVDFARLRRDLKLAYHAYWAMDQLHLLKTPAHIDMARRNRTLHEFLLPEEQPSDRHEIRGHAILKADLRGSSKIIKELRERRLNPATHFSLSFFGPVNELLDAFGAKKVFVEGDAVILSFYEYEDLPQDWLALCRASGLARKILAVVDTQNAQNRRHGLPELELGLGIAWLDEAPAFLYDGDHEIMISPAINRADRLSSCAASLRQTEIGRRLPRGIEVVAPMNQGIMQKDSGDNLLRYNVNGIELDPVAFPKLQCEVVLYRLEARFPQYSPNSVFYLGRYPDTTGVAQWLVVREAPVRLWMGNDTSVEETGGRLFYEIVTDPEVLHTLKQLLAAARQAQELAEAGRMGMGRYGA